MDYLTSFIIGTSPLITFQHFAPMALQNKTNIPYKKYAILAPLYYGLMSMLALGIGKQFDLSLELRLFITSIISIIFITSLNYFYSRKRYEPYKSYTTKEWLYYIIRNGSRHIIAFNLIMLYLEKYFPQSEWLKIFVIGSSAFSYLFAYYDISKLDDLGLINYDYRTFAVVEPFNDGFLYLFYLFILTKLFNFSLKQSLLIKTVLSPIIWLVGIKYIFNTYGYETNKEYMMTFLRMFFKSFVGNNIIFYYLLTHL